MRVLTLRIEHGQFFSSLPKRRDVSESFAFTKSHNAHYPCQVHGNQEDDHRACLREFQKNRADTSALCSALLSAQLCILYLAERMCELDVRARLWLLFQWRIVKRPLHDPPLKQHGHRLKQRLLFLCRHAQSAGGGNGS
jgi:hypothetical protein